MQSADSVSNVEVSYNCVKCNCKKSLIGKLHLLLKLQKTICCHPINVLVTFHIGLAYLSIFTVAVCHIHSLCSYETMTNIFRIVFITHQQRQYVTYMLLCRTYDPG